MLLIEKIGRPDKLRRLLTPSEDLPPLTAVCTLDTVVRVVPLPVPKDFWVVDALVMKIVEPTRGASRQGNKSPAHSEAHSGIPANHQWPTVGKGSRVSSMPDFHSHRLDVDRSTELRPETAFPNSKFDELACGRFTILKVHDDFPTVSRDDKSPWSFLHGFCAVELLKWLAVYVDLPERLGQHWAFCEPDFLRIINDTAELVRIVHVFSKEFSGLFCFEGANAERFPHGIEDIRSSQVHFLAGGSFEDNKGFGQPLVPLPTRVTSSR